MTAWLNPRVQSTEVTGGVGEAGGALITTFDNGGEVHPRPPSAVTVKEYVPGSSPEIGILVVLPLVMTLPGLRVSTHEPAGREISVRLPVATAQVGCEIIPEIWGAKGVTGGAFTTAPEDGADVQLIEFVTVKV
jgi:hypothetical protein